jgi:hypothetical protein
LASTKVRHRQNINVNKSLAEHLLAVLVRQSPQANKNCLITGVVETGKKFIGGVIDTGEEFFVSATLTPAKNFRLFGYFLPVSTTPGNTFIASINDTRSLKIRDKD